jgi:methionine biosynthesis protein MetW
VERLPVKKSKNHKFCRNLFVPVNLAKSFRSDLDKIIDLIPEKTRVLDLGCGDGTLLHMLITQKKVRGTGIEYSQNKILECVKKGVPVVHGNLNDGLDEFLDNTFDFVILSRTLQSVNRPDLLLAAMARVGKKVIISFINMGFIKSRCQLMFYGKMPMTKTLPYTWYNTPNTHLATIKDFHRLCSEQNLYIINKIPLGNKFDFPARVWPNMFSSTCVFAISAKRNK